jgi:hypothetical protein
MFAATRRVSSRAVLWVGIKARRNARCERLPFQWSLHKRDEKGDLQHFGFLADGGNDPREAFVESLLEKLAPTIASTRSNTLKCPRR